MDSIRKRHNLQGVLRDGDHPKVSQNSNDLLDLLLGLAYGLQYNAYSPTYCFMTIEETIASMRNILDLLSISYDPRVWAEILEGNSDLITYGATIYSECEIQILFNTLSGLISIEGASTLAGRMAGSLIFELPAILDQLNHA